jgi:hypothetical protein
MVVLEGNCIVNIDSNFSLASGDGSQRLSLKANVAPANEYNSSAVVDDSPIRRVGETESIQHAMPLTEKTPSASTTQWSEDFSSFHLFRRDNASSGSTIIRDTFLWAYGRQHGGRIYRQHMRDHAKAAKLLASVTIETAPSGQQPSQTSHATMNALATDYSLRNAKRKPPSGLAASRKVHAAH